HSSKGIGIVGGSSRVSVQLTCRFIAFRNDKIDDLFNCISRNTFEVVLQCKRLRNDRNATITFKQFEIKVCPENAHLVLPPFQVRYPLLVFNLHLRERIQFIGLEVYLINILKKEIYTPDSRIKVAPQIVGIGMHTPATQIKALNVRSFPSLF